MVEEKEVLEKSLEKINMWAATAKEVTKVERTSDQFLTQLRARSRSKTIKNFEATFKASLRSDQR